MPELIDRQALLEDMTARFGGIADWHYFDCVNEQPTIEAEPVRHGKWQWAEGYVGTMVECSVCGLSPMSFYSLPKNQIGRLPVYKYCPRCGARMDADANESMFADTFSQCDNCPDWDGVKCKSDCHGCEDGGVENG